MITGPTGPAIATPAIDTPRQAVNNVRFKIDCFIDILSFLYNSYTFNIIVNLVQLQNSLIQFTIKIILYLL